MYLYALLEPDARKIVENIFDHFQALGMYLVYYFGRRYVLQTYKDLQGL